jgi:hypothetical protein
MIKTTKKINLAQLDKEYNGEGLIGTSDDNGNHIEIGLAENNSGSELELKAVLDNHIAIDEQAIRAAEKSVLLAKLGITADEARLLLS